MVETAQQGDSIEQFSPRWKLLSELSQTSYFSSPSFYMVGETGREFKPTSMGNLGEVEEVEELCSQSV